MQETIAEVEVITPSSARLSLLRQIVDAADSLDEEGKAEILKKIKLQKALQLAGKVDEMLAGNTLDLSEDEITAIVSEDRKKRYNQHFEKYSN